MYRYVFFFFLPVIISANAQMLTDVNFTGKDGLTIGSLNTTRGKQFFPDGKTCLFSFRIDGRLINSSDLSHASGKQPYRLTYRDSITVTVTRENYSGGMTFSIEFINKGYDSIKLENIVPFGEEPGHVYITADGPPGLTRARLYRPGKTSVGIILPDNAWELGYGSFPLNNGLSICALAQRTKTDGCIMRRYMTIIPPGSSVTYELNADCFTGCWQDGIKMMFRDRYLNELDVFDDKLYQREDLAWIRNTWIISLMFAWDHALYDQQEKKYMIGEYMDRGESLFGGYDVIGIWPTWPRLGIDERNQWDLYRDMPGGLSALREISDQMHARGTRFFIAYNPWDNSTRTEDHMDGLSSVIKETDADGVVLDTEGKSSIALQEAADRVKKGVIMYSEGMAVTKDMPGIIAGRVHDAIPMQPLLNMNRIIRPDFSVFRVCHLRDGRLHREVAVSLFNGYGTEIISFAPDRPEWMEEECLFLGRTTIILRENASLFKRPDWIPLIDTRQDSIWVNEWSSKEKKLYTVFSLIPEGFSGFLIPCEPADDRHFVSLWNHRELQPERLDTAWYLPALTDAFHHTWLGTRREGAVDCVAEFNRLLEVSRTGDSMIISADEGDHILAWKGNPSYQNENHRLTAGSNRIRISDLFGDYSGTIVVQLFREDEIIDERILQNEQGESWLASKPSKTSFTNTIPAGMVMIPGAEISLGLTNPDQFIPYPKYSKQVPVRILPFLMDIYPITNKQYYDFLKATGYSPADTTNFLKHWQAGSYKPGEDNLPVVYVDLEDAMAYARWAGKRLPTEAEWQLAAQGTDGRIWPWGDRMEDDKCNRSDGHLTPVSAFPGGSSPYGVQDLVGNVWQLTGDVYENGSYTYVMIRGGSFFDPVSSEWYVKGGPQPLDHIQMLILLSPGFDRCSTVGFRCARDIISK